MARPLAEPEIPFEKIADLAEVGCTNEDIADICGFSVDTLTRRFAELLLKGRAERRTSLRRAQWKSALSGNVTMQIWLGKQELGQSEKVETREANPLVFRVPDEPADQPIIN